MKTTEDVDLDECSGNGTDRSAVTLLFEPRHTERKTVMKRLSMRILSAAVLAGLGVLGLSSTGVGQPDAWKEPQPSVLPDFRNSRYREIYLAGGCFWGVQAYFDRMAGVEYTSAGYANGKPGDTNYHSIAQTGHVETVYVVYDPDILPLPALLRRFYGIIDPTSLNRQGNDQGLQYRTGIYYVDANDRPSILMATELAQKEHSREIVTQIEPLENYVPAEDYHQDYLLKNPHGYCHIDLSSIPNERPLVRASSYPKPSTEEIRSRLSDLQFAVTQENGTEPPFANAYWDNKAPGLYVDIVTGEPLFASLHKFDSGSGWPSFTRPLQWDVLSYRKDSSHSMQRIEVRSRSGDSHLGHLFTDGLKEEGGLRYCINSAALSFVPVDELEAHGLHEFRVLFDRKTQP